MKGNWEPQHRDAALRQLAGDGREEGVLHAGAAAVRQHVASLRLRLRIEQRRHAAAREAA